MFYANELPIIIFSETLNERIIKVQRNFTLACVVHASQRSCHFYYGLKFLQYHRVINKKNMEVLLLLHHNYVIDVAKNGVFTFLFGGRKVIESIFGSILTLQSNIMYKRLTLY